MSSTSQPPRKRNNVRLTDVGGGETRSEDFAADELRCTCQHCRGQVPHDVDQFALTAAQRVRTRMEVEYPEDPVMILTSAFRCRRHPEEAKKSSPGRHNKGLAFDVRVPWGRKRMMLVKIALEEGFHGFGFADSFIHMDYRPEPLTSWTYN